MHIRYGTRQDAELLSELGAKTFFDAFAKDNTPENMDLYLKKSFSPKIQLDELSQPDNIFLIIELDQLPIGFAQLILDSRDEAIQATLPLEIRRIYSLQDYIGKGVGKELMHAAIAEARRMGSDVLWLGVWEKNQRAIDFYKKWGFRVVGTHKFTLGHDPQNDLIMLLELSSSALPSH